MLRLYNANQPPQQNHGVSWISNKKARSWRGIELKRLGSVRLMFCTLFITNKRSVETAFSLILAKNRLVYDYLIVHMNVLHQRCLLWLLLS